MHKGWVMSVKLHRSVILVRADWDEDAHVWFATSDDIDGLAIEASTLEELRQKILAVVPELAELNGLKSDLPDLPELPVHIMAGQTLRVPNPNLR
jgi:predicted PolB exonuclease-like 3'-5' exonuclease